MKDISIKIIIVVVIFKSYIFIVMGYVNINKLNQQNKLVGASIQIYEKILKEETSGNEDNGVFNKILEELGIGTKFIFQFGTGIGAFIGPVTSLLNNSGVVVSKEDVCLLIITSLAIVISNSKEDVSKLINEVNERGLSDYLPDISRFFLRVKDLMVYVAKQLGVVVYTLSDVLGFTFMLVPSMDVLKTLINNHSVSFSDLKRLVFGLSLATLSYYVKNMVNKIK